MPLSRADVAKRVAAFVLVVGVIVVGAAVAAAVLVPPPGGQNATVPTYPEYDADELVPDRMEETGGLDVDGSSEAGVVLVDNVHVNRFERGDLSALETAVVQAGGEVRYLESPTGAVTAGEWNQSLAAADALVIADPGDSYTEEELAGIEAFVDSGGRLLVAGEPNYMAIERTGPTGQELVTRRNHLTEVGSRFGLSFGTEYLVNMHNAGNDAIYKNVRAVPPEDADYVEGVQEAVFYTATTVRTADGTEVLVGSEGTEYASAGGTSRFPLAALNDEGTVLGVGDTTFLEDGNRNVADNEAFISRLAEFLAEGDADFQAEDSGLGGGAPGDGGAGDGNGDEFGSGDGNT